MSGGVPKRIQITRTQRNTPSKAGNPVPKKAIILCNRGRSRALCNYIQRRTTYGALTQSLPSASGGTKPQFDPTGANSATISGSNFMYVRLFFDTPLQNVGTSAVMINPNNFKITNLNPSAFWCNDLTPPIAPYAPCEPGDIMPSVFIHKIIQSPSLNAMEIHVYNGFTPPAPWASGPIDAGWETGAENSLLKVTYTPTVAPFITSNTGATADAFTTPNLNVTL